MAKQDKAKQEKEAHGETETEHPDYLGAQDTYYFGAFSRRHQECGPDLPADLPGRTKWTYSRATTKHYTDKSAITAADLLNDRVVPFFSLTSRASSCLKPRMR